MCNIYNDEKTFPCASGGPPLLYIIQPPEIIWENLKIRILKFFPILAIEEKSSERGCWLTILLKHAKLIGQ
jgi:hypothetical protein